MTRQVIDALRKAMEEELGKLKKLQQSNTNSLRDKDMDELLSIPQRLTTIINFYKD